MSELPFLHVEWINPTSPAGTSWTRIAHGPLHAPRLLAEYEEPKLDVAKDEELRAYIDPSLAGNPRRRRAQRGILSILMRIDQINVYRIQMPVRGGTYRMASDDVDVPDSTLVEVVTDDGLTARSGRFISRIMYSAHARQLPKSHLASSILRLLRSGLSPNAWTSAGTGMAMPRRVRHSIP
ncbi:trimethylamine methyltransferase family protein [Mesorhizobium amorphae]|uniref:trimethylamine methyltransferase family protein n=1 Tax=Mesorhizobium amorphae TaxID=71433 RepID=UPI001FEE0910|nr:trimethylamine methyltransferase family protein [Mesorhizobium amorphae]